MSGSVPIRDAATVILLRRDGSRASVLMGQRGRGAIFMPGKFVFPGGALDPGDAAVPTDLPDDLSRDLARESEAAPAAIVAAAIREVWEETGLILGRPAEWPDPPRGWRGYAATGHRPDGPGLRYFFRAITPPGRPRRFDARFLLADAATLRNDPDDFAGAEDELSHLQWIALEDVAGFDLPFITQVVLAELRAHLADPDAPLTVPFFRNDDETRLVTRLGGESPLQA